MNLLLKEGMDTLDTSTSLLEGVVNIDSHTDITDSWITNECDKIYGNALENAIVNRHLETAQQLLKQRLNFSDWEPDIIHKCFYKAGKNVQQDILSCLMDMPECKNLVNSKNSDGQTALHLAVKLWSELCWRLVQILWHWIKPNPSPGWICCKTCMKDKPFLKVKCLLYLMLTLIPH